MYWIKLQLLKREQQQAIMAWHYLLLRRN